MATIVFITQILPQNELVFFKEFIENKIKKIDCEAFANGLNTQGIRLASLTTLLLGDKIIKNLQDELSQIDMSNGAQVNSTITNILIDADYTQLGTFFCIRILK